MYYTRRVNDLMIVRSQRSFEDDFYSTVNQWKYIGSTEKPRSLKPSTRKDCWAKRNTEAIYDDLFSPRKDGKGINVAVQTLTRMSVAPAQ